MVVVSAMAGETDRLLNLAGEITNQMNMVAEGIKTVKSARALVKKLGVKASVIEETYLILHEGKSPQDALRDLLNIRTTSEFSGIKGL